MVACRYHAQGRCWNGQFCAFEHVSPTPSIQPSAHPSANSNWRIQKATSPKYLRGSVHKPQTCWHFLNGFCKFGSECWNYHPETNGDLDYEGKGSVPRSQVLCKDFLAGHCPTGSECAFSHNYQQFPAVPQSSVGNRRDEETQGRDIRGSSKGTVQHAHLNVGPERHVNVRQNDGRRMGYVPVRHSAATIPGSGSDTEMLLHQKQGLKSDKEEMPTADAAIGTPGTSHGNHSEADETNTRRSTRERGACAGDQAEGDYDNSAGSDGEAEATATRVNTDQRLEKVKPPTQDDETLYDTEDGGVAFATEEASSNARM